MIKEIDIMNNTRRLTFDDYDQGDYLIPKELLKNPKYKSLDHTSILLYSVLLDELRSVSAPEGLYDHAGNLYVEMTNQKICELLNIEKSKLITIKKQLVDYDLIEIEEYDLGKNTHIFPIKPTQN